MTGKKLGPPVMLVSPDGTPNSPEAPAAVAGTGILRASAAPFTRPNDTATYASGDLVANSTTAAQVVPMEFAVGTTDGVIRAASYKTSNVNLASGATFRLHLWSQAPTVTGGDNVAVFAAGAAMVTSAGYLGYVDCIVDAWFSDGSIGRGAPSPEIHFAGVTDETLYGLFEARGAIAPAAQAQITGTIAGLPN